MILLLVQQFVQYISLPFAINISSTTTTDAVFWRNDCFHNIGHEYNWHVMISNCIFSHFTHPSNNTQATTTHTPQWLFVLNLKTITMLECLQSSPLHTAWCLLVHLKTFTGARKGSGWGSELCCCKG